MMLVGGTTKVVPFQITQLFNQNGFPFQKTAEPKAPLF
jgi:hypothetical protein